MKKMLSIGMVICFALWMNPVHLLAMEGGAGQSFNNRLLLAEAVTTTQSESSDMAEPRTDSAKQAQSNDGVGSDVNVKASSKSAEEKTSGTVNADFQTKPSPPAKANPMSERSTTQMPAGNPSLKIENILLFIGNWWVSNPLNLQVWYIFSFIGLVFYLLRMKNFRRPLLFLSIIILGFYLGNSLDPISAVFNIIPKTRFTFNGSLIILGIMVVLSVFLGRFYCGWICPLGAIQELVYPKIKMKMPSAPDSVLKYLKYIVLVVLLYVFWRTGNNLWDHFGPLKTLVRFNGTELAMFFLVLTLVLSIVIERPLCRYVCPLGAIFALTSRMAILKIRADAGTCMVCGKCTGGDCPMNGIEATNTITDLPKVNQSECIYCLQCQDLCQREALHVSIRRIDKVSG